MNTSSSEPIANAEQWFDDRHWHVSGNKVLETNRVTTLCSNVYMPTTVEQVVDIVETNPTKPITSVCGGHEASNAALVAHPDAVIIDFQKLKDISIDNQSIITVQAGVLFRELADFVKLHHGALPIGTGPNVGVVGYIVNGGLSGYFSKRLGLLGQCVTKFRLVTSNGSLQTVTRESDPDLFYAVLGAGSAMGIVVDISFQMADESIVRDAHQFVAAFESQELGLRYSRHVLVYMRDNVLPNEGVSMEMVYTAKSAVVVTLVFYDTFQGDSTAFVDVIRQQAEDARLVIVQESKWNTWFDTAAALWPIIESVSGKPLALLQHSCGTKNIPSDATLDFLVDTWIGQAPLVDNSIVEIRTLGGAASAPFPSGNATHPFFADLIIMYDSNETTAAERHEIVDKTSNVVTKARQQPDLTADVSGTHSQADDMDNRVVAEDIFGTPEFASKVRSTKERVDPENRFRFHPFVKILPEKSEGDG